MGEGEPGRCELCGAVEWRPFLAGVVDYVTAQTFDLLQCARCELVVTRPVPEDLGAYYSARYRTDRQKQTGGWRTRRRADAVERHVPRGFKGRLLDLGCGTGAFAVEMQRRGWTVAVTELNEAVLDQMRQHGMEAKRPDEALRNGFAAPFDVITAWHVLEHVPEPLALAKWARANLAPGGFLQATVPNLAAWQAKQTGRHWMHLDVPRHLYHFTPKTLRDLLERAGLRVESQRSFALEYDVFGIMQSVLNAISSRPNVLYERLTANGEPPAAPRRDVVTCYALLPLLLPASAAHALIAAAAGKGGTLSVLARPSGAL